MEAVYHHGLGDDEAADEQEDRVVGEGREDHIRRGIALRRWWCGLEQRDESHAKQRRHRDRDRLGDPPHDHEGQDGREAVLVRLQVEGDQEHRRKHQRPQEEAHGAAAAFEALLGGREPTGLALLVERPVGPARQPLVRHGGRLTPVSRVLCPVHRSGRQDVAPERSPQHPLGLASGFDNPLQAYAGLVAHLVQHRD